MPSRDISVHEIRAAEREEDGVRGAFTVRGGSGGGRGVDDGRKAKATRTNAGIVTEVIKWELETAGSTFRPGRCRLRRTGMGRIGLICLVPDTTRCIFDPNIMKR